MIAQYDLCSVKIDPIIRELVSKGSKAAVAGQSARHASDPQLNAAESFANVVSLDLDDPEDRDHAEAMLYAGDSDKDIETETQEDLEAVPESGSEFDTCDESL